MRQTFSKDEKLCSRILIKEVAEKGFSFSISPFRIIWTSAKLPTQKFPVQVLMSVPKSNFKRAVDRNRIKRLMREAYRKGKFVIYNHLNKKKKQIAVMLVYTSKKEITYSETEQKITLILQRLNNEFDKKIVS